MPSPTTRRPDALVASALLLAACLLICRPSFAQTPPLLPDHTLTPGATLPVTVDDIKVPGYTSKVRNVPESVKREVYAEYGIKTHKAGEYEVDHLISLELGGSNSVKNLWPESYKTKPWNAHVKDQLENKLHDLVVAGQMTLPDAQHAIAADWVAEYKKVFQTDVPMTAAQARKRGVRVEDETAASPEPTPTREPPSADTSSATAPSASGQVWVNTKSGKYFRPGDRYYGRTKEGKYMPEADARKAGYVAAGGH